MTSKQTNILKLLLILFAVCTLAFLHWITEEEIFAFLNLFVIGYEIGFLYKWRHRYYLVHFLSEQTEGTVVVSVTYFEELSVREVRLHIGKVFRQETAVLSFQQISRRQAKEINETDWKAEWAKITK